MYIIYSHTNKINGKRYIGLTSYVDKPEKRWLGGLGYSKKHNRVFAGAIEKYGWDTFEHEILETNIDTLEKANTREAFWIAQFHTFIGDPLCHGYNATRGGDGSPGRIVSEAERAYRRQLKLGTKASEETRKKMSQTRLGKSQNMTARKKAACQYSFSCMVAARRKKVRCIETQQIWNSVTEAAKALEVAETTISAALNGRMKTVKKVHVEYFKE